MMGVHGKTFGVKVTPDIPKTHLSDPTPYCMCLHSSGVRIVVVESWVFPDGYIIRQVLLASRRPLILSLSSIFRFLEPTDC